MSGHFCTQCNRIRITSTGLAKGCLFADSGVDMKPYLRASDDILREALREDRDQQAGGASPGIFLPGACVVLHGPDRG